MAEATQIKFKGLGFYLGPRDLFPKYIMPRRQTGHFPMCPAINKRGKTCGTQLKIERMPLFHGLYYMGVWNCPSCHFSWAAGRDG